MKQFTVRILSKINKMYHSPDPVQFKFSPMLISDVHTHSFHGEIFNFTDVERTNTEINVQLFDNANDFMLKNKVEKYQMMDR